jgi:hypothetical protein
MRETKCFEDEEFRCMVEDIKVLLGGSAYSLDLEDPEWCSIYRLAMGDFYSFLHKWMIVNKYGNFFGKEVNAVDVCKALTTSSLDYEMIESTAFAEEGGYSSRDGRYILERDYIDLEEGKQTYQIPAGREIKRVLFHTPSLIDKAALASWGYGNIGMNTAMSPQNYAIPTNFGGGYLFPIYPAHDVILRAQHFNLTERIRQSDLTYKIKVGPNGTKLIHLFSVPFIGQKGMRKDVYKCRVWYYYYDISGLSEEDRQNCIDECKNIYSPHQIDLPRQDFCDLNHVSKIFIRRWMTSLAKETLGRIRGKFKGKIPNPRADLELDWDTLINEAKEERKELKDEIVEFLTSLTTEKILERKASEAENLNKILSYMPLKPRVF